MHTTTALHRNTANCIQRGITGGGGGVKLRGYRREMPTYFTNECKKVSPSSALWQTAHGMFLFRCMSVRAIARKCCATTTHDIIAITTNKPRLDLNAGINDALLNYVTQKGHGVSA